MLESTSEPEYFWTDILEELCKEMGITNEQFDKYHEIVGGNYKNFWHLWLELTEVYNNTTTTFWFDDLRHVRNEKVKIYGDWVNVLFDAIEQVFNEVSEDYVNIHYSW